MGLGAAVVLFPAVATLVHHYRSAARDWLGRSRLMTSLKASKLYRLIQRGQWVEGNADLALIGPWGVRRARGGPRKGLVAVCRRLARAGGGGSRHPHGGCQGGASRRRPGLVPIRVELNGLQVTNPRRPMRNALAADRIAVNLVPAPWSSGAPASTRSLSRERPWRTGSQGGEPCLHKAALPGGFEAAWTRLGAEPRREG